MVSHAIGWGPEDPVALVESCYQAAEWLLATHTAKGLLIPRPWIDHPYGEEEIALFEEELLPAMAVFLARVDAIDRAIEADQELLHLQKQGIHPLIERSPVELQRHWISVIPELHGVHRQNTEIVPLTRHRTTSCQQTEQPPQVMG